jgi:hypothetical protein
MENPKLKPFDLVRALDGDPIIFEYNDEYKKGKIIYQSELNGSQRFLVLFTINDHDPLERVYWLREREMFMAPKMKKLYIAIKNDKKYNEQDARMTSCAYETKDRLLNFYKKEFEDNTWSYLEIEIEV